MERAFAELTDHLHAKYEELRDQVPYVGTKPIPKFPEKGVIYFRNKARHFTSVDQTRSETATMPIHSPARNNILLPSQCC